MTLFRIKVELRKRKRVIKEMRKKVSQHKIRLGMMQVLGLTTILFKIKRYE